MKIISTTPPSPPLKREGPKRTCTKPLRFRDSTAPEPQRSPAYKLEPIKAVSLGPNHQALCPENLASKAEAVASAVHEKKKVVIRGPKQQPIWPENVASEEAASTNNDKKKIHSTPPLSLPLKHEKKKKVVIRGPKQQPIWPENVASEEAATPPLSLPLKHEKKKVVIRGPKQQPIWPENVASEDAASANSDNCAAKVRNMPKRSCGKPSRYRV